jgi:transcription-repair coupling factor (superfamily II helicase)
MSGRIEFAEDTRVEPLSLVQMVQSAPATYQLDGATALKFKYAMEEPLQRFEFIESLLAKLAPAR